MKIAVTYENGQVFQHFGHTEQFKLYDIEDGKIKKDTIINNNGSGHGALADILERLGTDILICGGIGGGAKRALAAANIKLCAGVSGDADKVVEALLSNELNYDSDANCDHHGSSGEHNCSGHNHSCI